jgi:hypothetical protein
VRLFRRGRRHDRAGFGLRRFLFGHHRVVGGLTRDGYVGAGAELLLGPAADSPRPVGTIPPRDGPNCYFLITGTICFCYFKITVIFNRFKITVGLLTLCSVFIYIYIS